MSFSLCFRLSGMIFKSENSYQFLTMLILLFYYFYLSLELFIVLLPSLESFYASTFMLLTYSEVTIYIYFL